MFKEINKIFYILSAENINKIAAGHVPLEKGEPVWDASVTEEKERASALAQKLDINNK